MRSRGPASSKAGGSMPARSCARSSSISARDKSGLDVSMKWVARSGDGIVHSPRTSVRKSGGDDVISRGTSWLLRHRYDRRRGRRRLPPNEHLLLSLSGHAQGGTQLFAHGGVADDDRLALVGFGQGVGVAV